MRHPGERMAALALAGLFLAAPVLAVTKAPTRAELVERRNALVDQMEGWRGLVQAQGEPAAALNAKLDTIRAELLKLPMGADIRSAEALASLDKGIEAHRTRFEDWKKAFLESLYAAKSGGAELAAAAPEERERFTQLVDKQADALRELSHQAFIHGEQLASLKSAVLRADAPAALDHVFDNGAALGVLRAAELAAPMAAPAATYERAAHVVPASYAQPLAHGIGEIHVDGAEPPAPEVASPAPATALARAEEPFLRGTAAKGDKRSWQTELLKRTGAWSLLSSVGVDPEAFLRSLTNAESGYATDATSSKGAAGVMQVMPDTACGIMRGASYKRIAAEYGLPVHRFATLSDGRCADSSRDAVQRMLNKEWRTNVLLGILYIKDQADSFVGYAQAARTSLENKAKLMMNMVAGAYNAGPGRVWEGLARIRNQGLSLASINPAESIVRISETKSYVRKILKNYGGWLFAESHAEPAGGSPEPARARG